jgi:hypothetical protein
MLTNPAWNACSVSVSVARRGVLELRVHASRDRARLRRVVQLEHVRAHGAEAAHALLVQVLVVEEHGLVAERLLLGVVDGADRERPGPG